MLGLDIEFILHRLGEPLFCFYAAGIKVPSIKIFSWQRGTGETMKNVKTPTSRDYQSYLLESLQDPSEAAAYLNAVLEEENPEPELLSLALQDAAKALAPSRTDPEPFTLSPISAEDSQIIYKFINRLNEIGLRLTIEQQ
jgi:hypothetical protein